MLCSAFPAPIISRRRIIRSLRETNKGELDSAMKLWGGTFSEPPDALAYRFNASLAFDQRLWDVDIRGSIAWAGALARAGVLTQLEADQIKSGLHQVHSEFAAGSFAFQPSDEDIHTAVERR